MTSAAAIAARQRAGLPQARPVPLPAMVHQRTLHNPHSTIAEPSQQRVQHGSSEVPFLSENELTDFSDAEANRKKICDLLWLAFPGCRSAREVQLRAAMYLGRDERTIRYWMEGSTGGPRWDEFAKLGGLVGFEVLLRIVYGRRR